MKPIFKFDRFVNLLARDIHINKRQYLTYILVGLGTIACLLYFNSMLNKAYTDLSVNYDPMHSFEEGLFWIGLFGFATVGASMTMSPLGKKGQSIAYLTFPASNIEKYLTRWLICVPGSIIVFLLGFECIDLIRCAFLKIVYFHSHNIHFFSIIDCVKQMNTSHNIGPFLCSIIVQSIYILGSSIWPKRAILYTTIALMIVPMMFSWLFIILLKISNNWLFCMTILDNLQEWYFAGLVWIFAGILVLFNYIVAYFRFKESEIIQRW